LALLDFVGLASEGGELLLVPNDELIKPRVWRFTKSDSACLEEVFSAISSLKRFDVWPTAVPGLAVVMPSGSQNLIVLAAPQGLIQAVGSSNTEDAIVVPSEVMEQILSGDLGIFKDLSSSLRFGTLDTLSIGSEVRAIAGQENPDNIISSKVDWLQAWIEAIRIAESKGISPKISTAVIGRFSQMSLEERVCFLTGG
jgi:hypothetical protein